MWLNAGLPKTGPRWLMIGLAFTVVIAFVDRRTNRYVATSALLGRSVSVTQLRGRFYDYHGIKLIPTFHPAYLLRNPEAKRDVWEDMKKIMALLDIPL